MPPDAPNTTVTISVDSPVSPRLDVRVPTNFDHDDTANTKAKVGIALLSRKRCWENVGCLKMMGKYEEGKLAVGPALKI